MSDGRTRARRRLSLIASGAGIAMGVVLPITMLTVLGWLWLWERGYALIWVMVTLSLTILGLLTSFLTLWWIEQQSRPASGQDARQTNTSTGTEPGIENSGSSYSPRESAAWTAVDTLAHSVDPAALNNRDAVVALGLQTVETVARHIHPDTEDALWRFTVPEALSLIERVSQRLKPLIAENIPLGDQLSVGQVMRIYRWRSAIDLASRAYDIWRIVRMMNPIAAATQEVRERINRSIYAGVREELAKRLAAAYVREVGRAAIDLYGGRLKVDSKALAGHITEATAADQAVLTKPAEPLRILILGQDGAGKSSLVNALAGEVAVSADVLPADNGFVPVRVARDGLPDMLLIDAPGLADKPADVATLVAEASSADLVVWVVGANRADRQLDRKAIAAVDGYFEKHAERRPAPKLLVISQIDKLRPIREWQPPYDLLDSGSEKARSISAAVGAVSKDLGFAPEDCVPACLSAETGHYNIDLVWSKIAELLPEAKRAQLVRIMEEAKGGGIRWQRVLSQAAGAGRLLAGALKHELSKR